MPDKDDELPALIEYEDLPTLPTEFVDHNSDINAFVEEDIQHANNVLKAFYQGWSNVKNIHTMTRLGLATMEVVERRRKLALKPVSYGEKTNQKRTFGYEDIE